MDWRHVPSLAALRAFEAAARLTSYSAAARELNVTPAAVAQHVRKLEDHFGLSLPDARGHDALGDARMVAEALRHLMQTGALDPAHLRPQDT